MQQNRLYKVSRCRGAELAWRYPHHGSAWAKKIMLVATRDLIAKVIEEGRADFTFSYLGEQLVTRIGGRLIRIPGVKASFVGERMFAVSPHYKSLVDVLNGYITDMRQKPVDQIRQAFVYAGFIVPEYATWTDVIPSEP
ncbi:hypothetical protein [Oleidesulfovibrio sp.]|uniref:hypothetical protein n=1 Tax=Oleidesulfovibrio sp. TaxID=2909707 RepID=UPI003A8AAE4D